MSIDTIERTIEEEKKRLLPLQNDKFCGTVFIELDMKFGGITGMRFWPKESVRI